jgi:hypothetical protein
VAADSCASPSWSITLPRTRSGPAAARRAIAGGFSVSVRRESSGLRERVASRREVAGFRSA